MSHAGHDLTVEDVRVRRAFNMQDAEQAALGARQRVIDQGVLPGTLVLNSVITAPPGATLTVWMPSSGGDSAPPRK
jgi:hypothetical protein